MHESIIDGLLPVLVTVVCSLLASGGLWNYLQHKSDKKSATAKMLLGLAHDRIVFLCINYIERGFITKEEYENIHKALYLPYKELGGNGTAEVLMKQVNNLPIRTKPKENKKENE